MLSAVWIYGCVAAFLGASVDCSTIPYPGRPALLSYSPARGEFPVASLFGRGYFSYIDETGNSRTISLEASPLHGIRIDAAGRPLFELGRSVDLENSVRQGERVKVDKLKPIKEFDEHPFQDLVPDKDFKLPEFDYSKQDVDAKKGSNEIAGATRQIFAFPTTNPGYLPPPKPTDTSDLIFSKGPEVPPQQFQSSNQASPCQAPQEHVLGPHAMNPGTVGMMLQPPAVYPASEAPGQSGKGDQSGQAPLGLAYLPPKPSPKPTQLNPENPFLPHSKNPLPTTTPTLITSSPSTTSRPTVSSQHSSSTASPVIQSLPPASSSTPSFAPGNPFLPTPSSVSVLPNSTPPPVPTSSPTKPPSHNPFLSPDKPKAPRPPPPKPTPQFNADKMNPFLLSLTPADFNPREDVEPSSNQIPQQVKDTPEVEKAKHEHFLAHQMALAQLQLAQQRDNDQQHETPSTSPQPTHSADTSEDAFEAITSGLALTVIPEPTEDSSPTTDAVPPLLA